MQRLHICVEHDQQKAGRCKCSPLVSFLLDLLLLLVQVLGLFGHGNHTLIALLLDCLTKRTLHKTDTAYEARRLLLSLWQWQQRSACLLLGCDTVDTNCAWRLCKHAAHAVYEANFPSMLHVT